MSGAGAADLLPGEGATWADCQLVAPFPYFGGKRRVAREVWRRFGDVTAYCEPFFGSGAVLLGRPSGHAGRTETVNDADGLLSNFWRAVRADPVAVAHHADWPVNEVDLHARHAWLVGQREDVTRQMEGDPDWYDARAAGWWVWGACSWIGKGWCSGRGPWKVVADADGASKLVRLGNAGQGVNRQRVHLSHAGQGARSEYILQTMTALAVRLRDVRVACGDWTRIVTPAVLWPTTRTGSKVTGVLLDPPYAAGERTAGLYAVEHDISADVRDWAAANGDNPALRIALCGYDSQSMPDGWTAHRWKTHGGYGVGRGNQAEANSHRETVWFSPHCLAGHDRRQQALFTLDDGAA